MSDPTIEVRCPICEASFDVPFILVGAPTVCPSCGAKTVPLVPVGTDYPKTGFEMTYKDFNQLLSVAAYRHEVGAVLAEWFDCEITAEGDSTTIRSRQGKPLDPVDLHRRIQNDPAKQRELYRVAMTLWR